MTQQLLDHWHLCDELSVVQAALLYLGEDPSLFLAGDPSSEVPRTEGYDAAMAALTHAILGGRLPAKIRRRAWERGWEEEPIQDELVAGPTKTDFLLARSSIRLIQIGT